MTRAFLASLLLVGSLLQDPEPGTFTLKNKETLAGRVMGIEGSKVVLSVSVMEGSATVRRDLSEFTPESAFRIRMLAAPPKTFDDHLKMAQTAIDLGILPQAGEHAGKARKLAESDATGAQRKKLDSWAADTLESLFNKAVQQGDLADARHYLKLLATRVAEERTEDQLGKMFDDLAAAEMKSRMSARTVAVSKDAPKDAPKDAAVKRAEPDKAWEGVLQHVEQADKLVKEGLRNSRKTVQATRNYEQAIDHYKTALREVQEVVKKQNNSPEAQDDAARLSQRIKDGGVQAALYAANALTVQGDYRSALEWANKVLAIDPANPDAKALIHTIQIAEASGWGWGGGWGR